ncbi:Uncharacterized protein SCF082_LOCUS11246 [Durusdinium trenchii]|uniref:Uncharacterized protein n=1 Tax=Durusdinium trenchii TaxID=1381693 RepID=A0ABP0JBL7_9DINO
MSLECFPSLQLLVACCPDPSVAPPEFHGCPAEFLSMRPSCCMPGVVVAVLKALETLSPQLVELMPLEGSYQETVTSIGGLMRTYLLDSDHQQMEAWRLYSLAFARTAIMEVDPIKDRFMQMQHVQDSQQLLRVAIQSSRRLLHSMFRLESLYIFLLGHTATTLQLKMQDVSPENVLEPFQPALNLYEVGMNTFDLLAYSIIPNLEAMIKDPQGRGFSMLQPPSRNHSAEEISLLAVSLGSWAKTGFLTLWSVLQHRSTALRVFILGDARGLEAVAEAVEELQKQEHGMLEGVSFEPLDFERDPNFRAYLEKYPKDCSFGAAGKAILARAVCHLVPWAGIDSGSAQSFGSWLGAATGVASGDVLFLVLASWVAGGGAKAGVFPLTIWSAGAMLAGVTMVVVHTMATRHVTPAATRALRFLCAVIPFVVAGTEMCHAVGGELVHRPPLPLAAPSWVNSMSPAGALGCGNAAQLADMAELSAGYCHQGTGGFSKSIANECGVDGKKLQAAARAVPPCSSWQAAQGTVTFVVTVAFTVVTGALGVLYTATHGEVLAAYLGILDDDEEHASNTAQKSKGVNGTMNNASN